MNRRRFLKSAPLISLTPAIPIFLGRSLFAADQQEAKDSPVLVVVQLDGGNDGINTVVPFKDDNYIKLRPKLHLTADQVIKLDAETALHPSMRRAGELFEDGRLSIVHGVGYPNPNRSHFESMNIWHAASTDAEVLATGNGWLGDAVSLQPFAHGPDAYHVGEGELPAALLGRRCTAISMNDATDLRLSQRDLAVRRPPQDSTNLSDFVTRSVSEAYVSASQLAENTRTDESARYPDSKLGQHLKLISQTMKSGSTARVYYTSQDGYDTHAGQLSRHGNLLGTLSSSLYAFMDDMKQSGLADRVTVLVFSEFGRRVSENSSVGTDHGTAGPVFLLGTKLADRNYGKQPSLADLEGGDLKHGIDFRDVYSSILTDALELRKPRVLEAFGKTKLFKA